MAVRDDTAPARPLFSTGDASTGPPHAAASARCSLPDSLRQSILDDVVFSLFALGRLRVDDEGHGSARPDIPLAGQPAPQLSPLHQEGVAVAIQCLEQYAMWLSEGRAMGT